MSTPALYHRSSRPHGKGVTQVVGPRSTTAPGRLESGVAEQPADQIGGVPHGKHSPPAQK
jgi:hypothetical protein